jgi:hypothetical protein
MKKAFVFIFCSLLLAAAAGAQSAPDSMQKFVKKETVLVPQYTDSTALLTIKDLNEFDLFVQAQMTIQQTPQYQALVVKLNELIARGIARWTEEQKKKQKPK